MINHPFDFPKLSLLSQNYLVIGKVLSSKKITNHIIVNLWNEVDYKGVSRLLFLPELYEDYSLSRGIIIQGNFNLSNNKLILNYDIFPFKDFNLLEKWFLAIFEEDLPHLNQKEIYIKNIIGKPVYTKSGILLGHIHELTDIPTPYPMVVVLTPKKEEKYLPLPEEYLIEVTDKEVIVSDNVPFDISDDTT